MYSDAIQIFCHKKISLSVPINHSLLLFSNSCWWIQNEIRLPASSTPKASLLLPPTLPAAPSWHCLHNFQDINGDVSPLAIGYEILCQCHQLSSLTVMLHYSVMKSAEAYEHLFFDSQYILASKNCLFFLITLIYTTLVSARYQPMFLRPENLVVMRKATFMINFSHLIYSVLRNAYGWAAYSRRGGNCKWGHTVEDCSDNNE